VKGLKLATERILRGCQVEHKTDDGQVGWVTDMCEITLKTVCFYERKKLPLLLVLWIV
jgi:hypothetical protein